jgi:O-antigen/teichoic acid export membrane protein
MGIAKNIFNNSFFSGSVIYLASNVISAAVPFALLPILTRQLEPAEYGEIAIFLTVLTALPAFVGLSVAGAANRKYFDTDFPESEKKYYNAACFQILLVSAAVVAVLMYVSGGYISEWIGLRKSWLMWAVLVSASLVAVNIRLGQWQVRKQAASFGAFQISQSSLNVALSLLLVIALHQGAGGRIAAQILVAGAFALLSVIFLFRDSLLRPLSYRPEYVREALQFGVPLIPHAFGGFLLIAFDRLVVSNMLGIESAGIYMVGVQLAGAMAIIFDAINKAYVPWLYQKLGENDDTEKRRIVSYTYIGYAVILIPAGATFLIGPTLVSMVAGSKYQAAGDVLGWLVLGQCFGGMYLSVTNYIFYAKRTSTLSLVTITSGALHVLFVLFFLTTYGLVGAGIAFSVSTGMRFLMTWRAAQRCHPMPWFHFASGHIR